MDQIASTRECRLLSASASAYGVDVAGGFCPPHPYFDAVGFVETPTLIVGGAEEINACLIGTNRDDGLIVAFRGTLPPQIHDLPSFLDWMQDFDAIPISVPGIPGMVHKGIWDGLDSIWPRVQAEITKRRQDETVSQALYVTGHGKGGGMAHLAAMRLNIAGIPVQEVVSFAAPRVGDQSFAEAYQQQIAGSRYEFTDDVVPHLPPDPLMIDTLGHFPVIGECFRDLRPWIYVGVGNLRFINWDKSILGDSDQLRGERLAHLALLLIRLKHGEIVNNHRAACGFGYMAALCRGICTETDGAREAAPRLGGPASLQARSASE
jgi:hypothetical protein